MGKRRFLSYWPLVFAVTFAALAIPLLWSLHTSQLSLREAIDARLLDDSERRAQAISDFVADLRQIAIDLATSQEINSYLTNRALGMSQRYGLNANIDQIRRQFEHRMHQALLGTKPTIRSISYFDQNGNPLARIGTPRQGGGATMQFEPSVTISNLSSGTQIVASAAVTFKQQFVGSVFIEIEPSVLSRLLVDDAAPPSISRRYQELLLSSDGSSTVASNHAPYPREVGLALLRELPNGAITSISQSERFWIARDLIGLRWQIQGTSLSFVALQSKADAYGQVASSIYLYVFAILAVIVFISACVIQVMLRRTTLLETAASESNRHRDELKEHNERLQKEIEKRTVAEHELHDKTTELDKLNADLRISAAAFDAQDAMIITDANRLVLRVNRAFCAMTGYHPEEVIGHKGDYSNSPACNGELITEIWASIDRCGAWQGEIIGETKNGTRYTRWLTVSSVCDANGSITHHIGTYFDLSERKKAEQRIKELAFFDQLTALPNRALLLDRAKQVVAENERSGQFGALLFIDLDNFKVLNDTLGHDVGDMQLKQVADRLLNCVRAEDTVSRFGGDEFVVLLPRLGMSVDEAALNSEAVAEKIMVALRQTYHLAGYDHLASCSIGVTVFGKVERGVDELLKRADLAMYEAKNAGRNAIRFYDPRMQELVTERATLESELRDALERDELTIYLQPQVDAHGLLVGAEALLRWQHPVRGVVLPTEFIPVAESSGLILPIGFFVLEAACRQLVAWSRHPGLGQIAIAVNVSAAQIHDERFVEQVLRIIDRTGADPKRLKFELTESVLVRNADEIIRKMKFLQRRGISFSLDDFGTGYSSLSYLKRLPLNQLKIDREFVKDVLVDANDAAIARMIVALGSSLELEVIAEGVETEQQRDYLKELGCRTYQGYLFGRPVPIDHFEHLVIRFFEPAVTLSRVTGDVIRLVPESPEVAYT
jgi:diguanylate cyclase (GGDEF)-like protein/PAS domain S-box-containing protein